MERNRKSFELAADIVGRRKSLADVGERCLIPLPNFRFKSFSDIQAKSKKKKKKYMGRHLLRRWVAAEAAAEHRNSILRDDCFEGRRGGAVESSPCQLTKFKKEIFSTVQLSISSVSILYRCKNRCW